MGRVALGGRATAGAMLLFAALACVLLRPAAAHAEQDLFSAYDELLKRVHPAPLLATYLPPGLGPVTEPGNPAGWMELEAVPESGGHYSMTYNRIIPSRREGTPAKLAADLAITQLHFSSLAVARRKERRFYRFSATTVRGHPGLAFRPRHGTTTGYLWAESGRVYEIATATPHTLSNAELLSTAQTLGHVEADLFGQASFFYSYGNSAGAGADLLVTDVAVIANVNWTTPCNEGPEGIQRGAGGGAVLTLPLSGGSFSLPPTAIASTGNVMPGEPTTWIVSISGSIAGTGGTLSVGASGESATEKCSLAPIASTLAPNPNI